MYGHRERGADVVDRIGFRAYLIRGVVKQKRLALEPVLDGQGNFTEVVASNYVLVPDNELERAHGLGEREVDGKFESGILWGIDGVECSLDVRGLFSFPKKGDDYVAVGFESANGIGKRGGTHGSLLPLLSIARRSLQLHIWTFRLNAGCSPGWGAIGVGTVRDRRIGTTFAAPVKIALPTRVGKLEDMLEDWDVVVAVRGGIRIVSSGVVVVAESKPVMN